MVMIAKIFQIYVDNVKIDNFVDLMKNKMIMELIKQIIVMKKKCLLARSDK